MAEVNLRSWSEISQASEGLQLNSTAVTLEHILARFTRLETRLVEHERRVAATLPPLQPEPDPPDRPRLYTAAQPPYRQFQSTGYNNNNTVTDPYMLSKFAAPNFHTTGSVQLPHSSYHTPAYTQPDGSPDSHLGFSHPPPQFSNMPYRRATSWDLPEPQAVRQTSCWDNPALRSHQGYHSYQQPIAMQQPLPQRSPSCWNPTNQHHQAVYCCEQPKDPHQHHTYGQEYHQLFQYQQPVQPAEASWQQLHQYQEPVLDQQPPSRPPSPRSATTPSGAISPPCSPDFSYDSTELIVDDDDESRESCPNTTIDRLPNRDQVGVKEVLLDVEEKDGFLQAFEVANFEYVDEAERAVDGEIPAPPSEGPGCSSLAFVLAEEIGPMHIEKYSQPAAPVVPPPPPQRSPSCWSSTSHSRSAAPLPAVAAAPSLNLPPLAPPCSPDIIVVEEVLLDDEEKVGILTDSSPSRKCLKIQEFCFRARSEALECMPTGPDNWATAYISDVNALMIYCPRRPRILGILGVHEVDASAISALATHRRVWTNIGSIDCRKVETSLGNIASPLTNWLSVVIVFIDCRKYCVFDPGGLANKGAVMGIDEETFHLSGLELIDGVVLINQCVICASIKDMCLENCSIRNVKKVASSFNDARVSSYDVVEDGCVKQGGVPLCAFLGDKIAYGLPQDWMKIASLYVDVYVSDVDSINHRSTSFETDSWLIPPHTDMLCLNIFGRVDELPILAVHCSEPKSPSLVLFEGNNEGRCSTVRCAFDPGGDTSPKLLLLTLFVASWFPP